MRLIKKIAIGAVASIGEDLAVSGGAITRPGSGGVWVWTAETVKNLAQRVHSEKRGKIAQYKVPVR